MTRTLSLLVALAIVAGTVPTLGQSAPTPPAPAPAAGGAARLPVRRVVLYKSGVGYFEHLGRVSGAQTVSIDLTSGQLDDVLKSLTTVDLGGGQVAGITYNTEAPLAEQLRKLRLPLSPSVDRTQLLQALRGARVEVSAAGTVVPGRVLSVAQQVRGNNENQRTLDELSIVTDGGTIRTFELVSGVGVTLADGELRRDLGQYLDVMSSARAQDVRRLQVAARGTGERDLFVSYVSAVPVWKTTYRLVIPSESGRKPFLQGWAIVDNTLGEDWTDVELSLVAGAPQTFVQPLSTPIYTQRPFVPIQTGAMVAPEIHGGAMTSGPASVRGRIADAAGSVLPGVTVRARVNGNVVSSTNTDAQGMYQLTGVPAGTATIEAELSGFKSAQQTLALRGGATTIDFAMEVGSMSETVTVATAPSSRYAKSARGSLGGVVGGVPAPPPPPPPMAARPALESALADVQAAAAGAELGELFEYKLKQPITVRRNQSALVPVVQHDVTIERVSLWSAGRGVAQPLRAVWLTNDTGLTLDGGSLSLVEAGAFAGEGLVEAIKPGEKRFVSYAMDLGVRVTSEPQESAHRVSRIRVASSVLTHSIEERASTLYTIRNDDAAARDVVIEHPARAGWTVVSGVKPAESSAGAHRFRVAVAPKSTATLTVAETHPIQTTIGVSDVSDDDILLILKGRNVPPGLEPQLRAVAAKSREVAQAQNRIDEREAEVERIDDGQERIRENLKALENSAAEKALIERYARQLSTQEDRLEVLHKEIETAEADRDAKQQELTRLVSALAFDVEMP